MIFHDIIPHVLFAHNALIQDDVFFNNKKSNKIRFIGRLLKLILIQKNYEYRKLI